MVPLHLSAGRGSELQPGALRVTVLLGWRKSSPEPAVTLLGPLHQAGLTGACVGRAGTRML